MFFALRELHNQITHQEETVLPLTPSTTSAVTGDIIDTGGCGLVLGRSTGCVSLTTNGTGGTAHTCSGRHSQYSCELLASWVSGVALLDAA